LRPVLWRKSRCQPQYRRLYVCWLTGVCGGFPSIWNHIRGCISGYSQWQIKPHATGQGIDRGGLIRYDLCHTAKCDRNDIHNQMNNELLALFFGLASAAVWGAGDFGGGIASRRNDVFMVVLISQVIGGVLLVALAVTQQAVLPTSRDVLMAAIAGVAGMIGVIALYSALAQNRMGVVAPLTAVITAIVPVIVSLFLEGVPPLITIMGFGLALIAVWMLTQPESGATASITMAGLGLALVAGLGFGLFFIFMDQASTEAVLWPVMIARAASIVVLLCIFVGRRRVLPSPGQLPIIAAIGIFDVGGNAFFAIAAQAGRLDIAAVLSSLYPVSTVLLAWFILKENLNRHQWAGVAIAVVALVLIAL
jgi:drug/metabolite transporter (DMT)-like permease